MRIDPLRFFVDGAEDSRVLALCELTITRASGERFGTQIAYLYTFDDDRTLVRQLNAWLKHESGLAQLSDPVEVSAS